MENISNIELKKLASDCRNYCENKQERDFDLNGACHENVIGAADYIRFETKYNPIIVWGVVSHKDESETADKIENVSEDITHFWLQLEKDGKIFDSIIDVYANNPIMGDEWIEEGKCYYGNLPKKYNIVQRIRYYGQLDSNDLCSKNTLLHAVEVTAAEIL